jgi:hypothetical protein
VTEVAPALLSVDALAARAPSLAPGMHEVARGDLTGIAGTSAREIVRAEATDTCARLALVAQPPVRAWLSDARGDVLAEAPDAGEASLGPRGPVCVRKGDAITLHLEASEPSKVSAARFVAWASP